MATTVRVDERVAAQLREIALEEHRSMGQVIAEAVARSGITFMYSSA